MELTCCVCTPAPVQLMKHGLFACSPISPTLAVDLRVLEFMKTLFVWLTPNTTAWCEALESFLDTQGYRSQSKVCFLHNDVTILLVFLLNELHTLSLCNIILHNISPFVLSYLVLYCLVLIEA